MTERSDVLPVHNGISEVWFHAAAENRLLVQRDRVSGVAQMYPRSCVVGAPDREPEWVDASGKGELYSFTVVERSVHPEFAERVPFILGIVELAEGPRMTTWMVDVGAEELYCGMPVKVVFREIHPNVRMPCFTKEVS